MDADSRSGGDIQGHLAFVPSYSCRGEQSAVEESLICKSATCHDAARHDKSEVVDTPHVGGLCSDWKLRVINRAPLAKEKYAQAH